MMEAWARYVCGLDDDDPLGVFRGRVLMPQNDESRAIGVGPTKGNELVRDGVLIRKKIGRASYLLVESLLKVAAEGVPPPASTAPRSRGRFSRQLRFRRGN
jgi:hypothetical protein